MAFSENSTIFIVLQHICSVKKLHKHNENVRASEPRGHTDAGCVKFFNHLDKNFFVEARDFFMRISTF